MDKKKSQQVGGRKFAIKKDTFLDVSKKTTTVLKSGRDLAWGHGSLSYFGDERDSRRKGGGRIGK